MSHFTVLVVGDNVEEQLAPFQENNMDDCPEEYLRFHDLEDEWKEQYEKEGAEYIVMPNGELKLPWDECFKMPPDKSDPGKMFGWNHVPEGLEHRQVPFKETFPTFEAFVKDWHGGSERDEQMKRYGYWENPNTKWDWYQIGGRWTGYFKLRPLGLVPVGKETLESLGFTENELSELRKIKNKNGKKFERLVAKFIGKEMDVVAAVRGVLEQYPEHSVGSPGLMTEKAKPGYADSCLKKYIDFETMRRQSEEYAAKQYDLARSLLDPLPPSRSWDDIREEYCPNDDFKRIDEARKAYHDQARVKALKGGCVGENQKVELPWDASPEDYDVPRDQYLRKVREGAISTFAVLKDGKWYERGKMGWWAVVSDEKDEETWNSMFSKLLDELPDDTLLTVVDCHI